MFWKADGYVAQPAEGGLNVKLSHNSRSGMNK